MAIAATKYAIVQWSIDDIHTYRKDNDLSTWTDWKAEEFLLDNEKNIRDRLVEMGWEVIGEFMGEESN